jgi:DNA mismatch repair ATPase MutS
VNILFAQTICIASAENFKMTPFRMIETYLHIPDSKGSQSLFEAEMYRSRDYLERLKELDSKDFSFIVLDEIFSSTNYIEGFSGAYAILKKIGTFQNTLSMTTTHYSDLEKLEKDTKGRFENYKFEVTYEDNDMLFSDPSKDGSKKTEEKKIHFHYKLIRGTSRQYIALDLLERNGFDSDIIKDAIEMSKKIKITNGEKRLKKKEKKKQVE